MGGLRADREVTVRDAWSTDSSEVDAQVQKVPGRRFNCIDEIGKKGTTHHTSQIGKEKGTLKISSTTHF